MSTRRAILTSTLGNAVPPLAALITAPLLAHGLGVSGRGELAAATAPLILATTILTIGIPESFTFYVARQVLRIRSHLLPGLFVLVLAGIAGSGLIAVLALPLSSGDRHLSQLILLATTALVPALLVSGLRGIAAGRQLWRRTAIERSIGAIVRLAGVAVFFFSENLTPMTATATVAASTFLGGIVYLLPARTRHGMTDREHAGVMGTRGLFRYGSRVWVGSLAGVLLMRLDQLLMTPLSSVEQLGIYAVSASISELILIFNSAVRDVMFSAESRGANLARVGQAARLSTFVTVLMAIGIACVAPVMIPVFFGTDFIDAVPVTLVLIAAVVVGNPGSVAGAALSARGRPELRSLSIVIALVINVALVMILVPPFGALGAAVATLAGNLVSGNLNVVWMSRHFAARPTEFYGIRRSDLSAAMAGIRSSPRV